MAVPRSIIRVRRSTFRRSKLGRVCVPTDIGRLGGSVFTSYRSLAATAVRGAPVANRHVFTQYGTLRDMRLNRKIVQVRRNTFRRDNLGGVALPKALSGMRGCTFSCYGLGAVICGNS